MFSLIKPQVYFQHIPKKTTRSSPKTNEVIPQINLIKRRQMAWLAQVSVKKTCKFILRNKIVRLIINYHNKSSRNPLKNAFKVKVKNLIRIESSPERIAAAAIESFGLIFPYSTVHSVRFLYIFMLLIRIAVLSIKLLQHICCSYSSVDLHIPQISFQPFISTRSRILFWWTVSFYAN